MNDQLWDGKFIETDRHSAIANMPVLIDQLAERVASMEREADNQSGSVS